MTEQATRALVTIPANALNVDPEAAKVQAKFFLDHAAAGSPAFPRDLTPMQASEMARVALAYGLDPILGELMIYQGHLYVGIDGRERIANNDPRYEGMEIEPANETQRKAFRVSDDEHLWVCKVWRKDRRFPFVNYGRAGGPSDRNTVSKSNPAEMAMKRAKHRALRDAFSMPLPGREEVSEPFPVGEITRHGEIIEAEAYEVLDNGISRQQTTVIHVLIKQMAWDDEEYREVLRATFGVASSTDLSEAQAAALIEMLVVVAERAKIEAWREGFHNDLVARGLNLASLWDDGLPEDYGRPVSASPPPVLEHEPSTVDVPITVEISSEPPTRRMATTKQIADLKAHAPAGQQRGAKWDELEYDQADTWLASLDIKP